MESSSSCGLWQMMGESFEVRWWQLNGPPPMDALPQDIVGYLYWTAEHCAARCHAPDEDGLIALPSYTRGRDGQN